VRASRAASTTRPRRSRSWTSPTASRCSSSPTRAAARNFGSTFEELAGVLDRCALDLGICLDTAHLFAAGYDLSTPAGVDETFEAFEEAVGSERLACVHLNDSKHDCGTNKDEHAHVGEGEIGEAGMEAFINHGAVEDVPLVLETPTEDGRSFAWNVERVRELRAS